MFSSNKSFAQNVERNHLIALRKIAAEDAKKAGSKRIAKVVAAEIVRKTGTRYTFD